MGRRARLSWRPRWRLLRFGTCGRGAVTESYRMLGHAIGRRLPGSDALDRCVVTAVNLRQQEWSVVFDLALIGIGRVIHGDMFSIFSQFYIGVFTLVCVLNAKLALLSAYTHGGSWRLLVKVPLAILWVCICTLATIAWSQVEPFLTGVMGTVACHILLGKLDDERLKVAMSITGLAHFVLRQCQVTGGFWWRQLCYGTRILVMTAFMVVVAVCAPRFAALAIDWDLRLAQLENSLYALMIAWPLISSNIRSVLSAQARRAVRQGWRRLTRCSVARRA